MAENPNINHTMGTRRDQRAADELIQEHAAQFASITAGQIEVWQKQMALCANSLHYVGDQLSIVSRSFEQMLSSVQRTSDRRAG
jgi:hypothetical protein